MEPIRFFEVYGSHTDETNGIVCTFYTWTEEVVSGPDTQYSRLLGAHLTRTCNSNVNYEEFLLWKCYPGRISWDGQVKGWWFPCSCCGLGGKMKGCYFF